jgi:uncharacterized protein (DUF2147 family)
MGLALLLLCGKKTCGRILTDNPGPGQSALDVNNPDPAMRTRRVVGINVLIGFTRKNDEVYKGGTIYDPNNGKTYRSEFKLKRDGNLEVKGCVGPFCQTEIWTPVR